MSVSDMGMKTVANDLDNARISFEGLRVPRSALLSRFGDVSADGEYIVGEQRMRIEVIGQRLLTGRLVIAEAAMVGLRVLLEKTMEYCRTKRVNGLGGTKPALAELPQLRTLFSESFASLDRLERFCAAVEDEMVECLRRSTIPNDRLVERIATAKVRCIEDSMEIQHKMEAEVGSYALMSLSGFQYKGKFRAKREITLIARGMKLTRPCSHAPIAALLLARVRAKIFCSAASLPRATAEF